jgi:PhnB protein
MPRKRPVAPSPLPARLRRALAVVGGRIRSSEEDSMAVKPIPEGYHTYTPYFVLEGASDFIEFVKKAFGGEEIYRFPAPGGKVGHAEVRVGDSVIMLADTNPEFPPSKMVSYLYVPDVDATYKKALAVGARSQREPANQFYGDRVCTVTDRWGNSWSIGTHVEDVPPDEMERRMKAQKK